MRHTDLHRGQDGGRDEGIWFERRRRRWRFQIVPVSTAGWAVVAGYAVFAIAISLVVFRDDRAPNLVGWIVWGALMAAASLIYAVTLLRMSAPAERKRG